MLANSLLWQITSSETNIPKSFLFGTMHVRDQVAFSHMSNAILSLQTCSEFKSEIDLDKAKESFTIDHYLMKDHKTLNQILGESKFQKLRSILLKAFQIDIQHMDRITPLIIINKVTESLLSDDNAYSADSFLWHQAQELNIQCSGLESIEEQTEILAKLDLDTQIKMLKEMGKNVSKFRANVNGLCELYAQQKVTQLHKRSSKGLGQFRHILINDRNQIMADRIFDNIKNACFYAVGAAHLAGDKGVIAFLKRKGLKLKPLNSN